MTKKLTSLILILSYITTCNGPCYGLGARTLFQHKSYAQRNLKTTDSYKDIADAPSFLSIPQKLGRIVEYYKGDGNGLVVHIQDRHTDPITQNNVASIIETLNQQYNIHLMCLEGASEELDTSFYDSFKDTPLKQKAARFFVEKALFTGAEFYKITNRTNYLKAVGVEDKDTYLEHLANYKNNQISKNTALNLLRSLSAAADNLQDRVYSKSLKGLDNISRTYLNGGLNFSEYISRLKVYVEKSNIEIKAYPNLEKFINLAEKEKTIDFDGASKEREAVVNYFAKKLKKEEARELIQMSVDFRLNKLSEIVFYDYLESLIIDHQLQTTGYKNLFAYIGYLRFSKTINHLEVFNEAEDLEENAQLALCDNPVQKQLVEYSKAVRMLRDLYNLKLTRRHLDYMEENPVFFDIIKIQRFLKNISDKHGLRIASAASFTGLDRKAIEESKKFYALALERDIALTENTLKSMKQYHEDKSVLIAGGFHTQGITNILKEKDISYVVICPTIGPDDCEKLYNDRMQGLLPDIAALSESFAHTLPVPLYTGGIADKALSNGVQERFAALLDTAPRARLSIEEKPLAKASSAGSVITVGRDKSIKLPAQSPDRLKVALGPCIAVAVFNQKIGEGYLSHLFPVVPAKQLSNAVEWKQHYFDRVIGHVKGDEWNVAVIGSDTSLDIFPVTERRIILEDIVNYLQKNGVKNIQIDPQFAKKVVSFDSTGKVTINLLEHRNIQYPIGLGAQEKSLTGSTTVANVVEKIASKGIKKSDITFKWLNAQRMAQLQNIVEESNSPEALLSEDTRLNFAAILADFIIRKASQGADNIRPIDVSTKASSAGRSINVWHDKSMKLPARSPNMLEANLGTCLAVAAFSQKTGEGSLSHFFPAVPIDELRHAVEWKQYYMDTLIGDINGDEWNVAVIGSDTGYEMFSADRKFTIEEITDYLQKNGVKNIETDPPFTEKVVSIDSTGKVTIELPKYNDIQYAIDLSIQKTSSAGTKILSEELRINTNEALNHYIAPLYDPLSYLGLGRVTFITNARSFTEVDKKHLRRLAMQNRGLLDEDPKKITIITVYDQAKAALKDCGFMDNGKRPSVLGITDFNYLTDGRWQEMAQGEQIAMVAASIRGQNRAVITITNDKVAEGIASTIPQYLDDRKKGKIVIASMQGATQRTKIGNDIIEEDEIMFSAVLAHAVKETRTQLRERDDQQLFILETLPPIDSMAFEKFIKSLMDTKAAIDAAASAA